MVTGVDIFKEFLALAKTITTTATITSAFVDEGKDSPLPQVVVFYPSLPRKRYTYGTSRYNRDGFINVDVITETSRSMKEIAEEIQDVMFTNYKTSISVSDLEVAIGDEARIDIGGKTVYMLTLTFDFKCRD